MDGSDDDHRERGVSEQAGAIMADIPNYANTQPVIQIGELRT